MRVFDQRVNVSPSLHGGNALIEGYALYSKRVPVRPCADSCAALASLPSLPWRDVTSILDLAPRFLGSAAQRQAVHRVPAANEW